MTRTPDAGSAKPAAGRAGTRAILIFVLAVAWLGSSAAFAQTPWGTRSYEGERPEYFALVKQLERQGNQLTSRIREVRNRTEAFLGKYPAQERARMVQEYERHADYRNRHERFLREYERERQAKALYDDARAVFTPQDERRPEVRANLWTKHLDWRRSRIAARKAELALLDSKLVVMQGLVGFEWDGFWADNAEDLVYVYKSVLAQYPQDVFNCFVELAGSTLATQLGRAPTDGLAPVQPQSFNVAELASSAVEGCVVGSAMKAMVNALEAAWKKQFLDRMATREVLEGVAEYWWDEIVIAKLPEEPTFARQVAKQMAKSFGVQKVLAGVMEKHTEQVTARVFASREQGLRKAYESLIKNPRIRSSTEIKQRMLGVAEERGKVRASELMKTAKLVVDYGGQLALMWQNSSVFAQIEANELGRYRAIVECLAARQQPVTAPAVVGQLKRDASSFASFVTECRTDTADEELPGSNRIEEILARLEAFAGTIQSAATLARTECRRAQEGLDRARSAFERQPAQLAALRAKLQSSHQTLASTAGLRVQIGVHEREAYAAAGRIVDAKQKIEAAELEACTAGSAGSAREAQALAAGALRDLARAASAAQQAAQVEQQLRTAIQQVQSLPSDAAALRRELGEAQAALAGADSAAQAAHDLLAPLAGLEAEAAGLHAEASASMATAPAGAVLSGRLDGAMARIRSITASLAGCPGDLPAKRSSLVSELGANESALAALEAELAILDAGGAGALTPAELQRSVAEAKASAGTAEVYAEAVQAAAQRAGACAAESATPAVQPPPDPRPTPAPGTGGGSWVAGPVEDRSGTGGGSTGSWKAGPVQSVGPAPPAATPPPAFDASPWIQAATSQAAACRYPAALSHADQLAQVAPGHPWLRANHAKLRDLASRQFQAVQALQQGRSALQTGDFRAAGGAAGNAAGVAPSCMKGLIQGFADAVNNAFNDNLQRHNRERAERGSELISTLTELIKQIQEPANPSGAASSSEHSGGSAGSTGGAGGQDPCAFKYEYKSKWSPTPTCTCPGYRYTGGKCVGSPGGTGGTATSGGSRGRPTSGGTRGTYTSGESRSGSSSGSVDDRPPCQCKDKNGKPYALFFGQSGCLDPEDAPASAAANYECKP